MDFFNTPPISKEDHENLKTSSSMSKIQTDLKSFKKEPPENYYKQYFPNSKGNITIPSGKNALYISSHLNENKELLTTKGINSSHPSIHHSKNVDVPIDLKSRTFFFRQTLNEQNYEMSRKFRIFKGINRINPVIKERFREEESLKIAKSLLLAHDHMLNSLQDTNQKILGLGTKDLVQFSRFNDPLTIKSSIQHGNGVSYKRIIQKEFSLTEDAKNEENLNEEKYLPIIVKKNEGNINHSSENLDVVQGKNILLTKDSKTQKTNKGKIRKIGLKQMNFKKNQMALAPISLSFKVKSS